MVESEDELYSVNRDGNSKTKESASGSNALSSDVLSLMHRLRYATAERAHVTTAQMRGSSRVGLYSSLDRRWRLPVPALRILIMAVGTRWVLHTARTYILRLILCLE